MYTWPKYHIIYEINTWIWLGELGQKHEGRIDLGSVPAGEWDYFSALKVDAVWFMGVWERSPAGIRIALQQEDVVAEYRRVLPDFTPEDVVGSPYCVRRYRVDENLGGPKGLAVAREELARRGIGLILDFVPNHTAHDCPWIWTHPGYYIQGNHDDLAKEPRRKPVQNQTDRFRFIERGNDDSCLDHMSGASRRKRYHSRHPDDCESETSAAPMCRF